MRSLNKSKQKTKKTMLEERFIKLGDEIVAKFKDEKVLIPSYKLLSKTRHLYITLHYKKSTDINSYKVDIFFTIELSMKFPDEPPFVRCFTDFQTPSLNDNKNLILSILEHQWTATKDNTTEYAMLAEIISKVGEFIKKVFNNGKNKCLVYYGFYQINKVMDLHPFIMSNHNTIFKVHEVIANSSKMEARYIVLTDAYFLMFEPHETKLNKGKLLFQSNLIGLKKKNITKTKSNVDSITLVFFIKGKGDTSFEFVMDKDDETNKKLKLLQGTFDKKVNGLRNRYQTFQEDPMKPPAELTDASLDNTDPNGLDELKKVIKEKEGSYLKKKTISSLEELIKLYGKIILILSDEDDDGYMEYLNKQRNLFCMQEIITQLEKENPLQDISLRNSIREKMEDLI
jgi:hypothetical protein